MGFCSLLCLCRSLSLSFSLSFSLSLSRSSTPSSQFYAILSLLLNRQNLCHGLRRGAEQPAGRGRSRRWWGVRERIRYRPHTRFGAQQLCSVRVIPSSVSHCLIALFS
jgi:hypothetical protein